MSVFLKKTFIAFALAVVAAAPSRALDRDEAVRRATYLTTMMIADLAMPEQYRQAVYMANYDYIMGLHGNGDLYSYGWQARNRRLRKLMKQHQWERYVATRYYRPVGWGNSGIVFYFGAPVPAPVPRYHHHDFDDDDYEDFLEDLADDYKDHRKKIKKYYKKQYKEYKKALKHHNKHHDKHHKKHHHHDDDD